MPTPVAIKVSAELAESARNTAEAADRSLTGQIEHWAKLGRAAETIMPAQVAATLKRCAGDINAIEDDSMRSKVLSALAALQTESAELLRRKIGIDQQTVFEPDPEIPGGLIRICPDGSRLRGVMDQGKFVPKNC